MVEEKAVRQYTRIGELMGCSLLANAEHSHDSPSRLKDGIRSVYKSHNIRPPSVCSLF